MSSQFAERNARLMPYARALLLAMALCIALFAVFAREPLTWSQPICGIAAAIFTTMFIRIERHGDVESFGLGEVAVGLTAVLADDLWGILFFTAGVIVACVPLHRADVVRWGVNSCTQVVAAAPSLFLVRAMPNNQVWESAARALVAAFAMCLLCHWLLAGVIARVESDRHLVVWRRSLTSNFLTGLVSVAVAVVVAAVAVGDRTATVVILVAGAAARPLLTARLLLETERARFSRTLTAVTQLLRVPDSQSAREVLARTAQDLTGSEEVWLEQNRPSDPTLLVLPIPTEFSRISFLAVRPQDWGRAHASPREALETLTISAAAALDAAEMHIQWRERAERDPLTGLLNRRAFVETLSTELARAQRADRQIAVCFLDLNGFKAVNDTYGHHVGDQVLRQAAEQLRTRTRSGDVAARFGGDEFCVMLVEDVDQLTDESIRARFAPSVRLEAPPDQSRGIVAVWASLGISRFPSDALIAEELMLIADARMYEAKRALSPRTGN